MQINCIWGIFHSHGNEFSVEIKKKIFINRNQRGKDENHNKTEIDPIHMKRFGRFTIDMFNLNLLSIAAETR